VSGEQMEPALAERLAAVIKAAQPHQCRFCNGEEWVEDENWSPEDWQIRAGVQRTEYDGLIPCGWCDEGMRTDPLNRDVVLGLLAESADAVDERDALRGQLDRLLEAKVPNHGGTPAQMLRDLAAFLDSLDEQVGKLTMVGGPHDGKTLREIMRGHNEPTDAMQSDVRWLAAAVDGAP
jgi:hypothetical protein